MFRRLQEMYIPVLTLARKLKPFGLLTTLLPKAPIH